MIRAPIGWLIARVNVIRGMVSGKEILLVKQLLDMLNIHFPVVSPGIPIKKWQGNNLVSTHAKEDPYFCAYKSENCWWLICRSYSCWSDSYPTMLQCCQLITQEYKCIAHPCHEHPVSIARYKKMHFQKKVVFIGDVSWE